jgi:hypothetical protein
MSEPDSLSRNYGKDMTRLRVGLREDGMSQQPIFQPFNPDGELRIYVRSLPHWRQPGATYFVTFRQGDSIPERVLAEWLDTFAERPLPPTQ